MLSAPARSQIRFSSTSPVEPAAGTWQMISAPAPASFRVDPPPANDSAATAAELAELRILAGQRTARDLQQIRRWSVHEPSVAANWEVLANLLARRYNLTPPAAARLNYAMTTAMHSALIAAWDAKYRYLRPRPHALDARVASSVIPVPEHPAYPSGHSTAAGAASTILARFFPAEAGLARAVAQDSGLSRLKAGVHYRSDHTAGFQLGRQVAEAVLATIVARDRGPLTYLPPAGTRPLATEEFLAYLDCQQTACQIGR